MLACTKSDLAVVEELVQSGAGLSLKNKDGWTPFHISCRYVYIQDHTRAWERQRTTNKYN